MRYEHHDFADKDLKIIYHLDRVNKSAPDLYGNIHNNPEFLLAKEGDVEVTVDNRTFIIHPGEIAVIAPNCLHVTHAVGEECLYYCLIVDIDIYDDWFGNEEIRFPQKTDLPEIVEIYNKIFSALKEKQPFYKQEVKSNILLMLSLLFRQGATSLQPELPRGDARRLDMVRHAIQYMFENFEKDISVDDICHKIGFSKYYFCRTFKEIAGVTPLWYLNYIRCRNAQSLLKSGKVSITETALKSGFNNASYFCKIYKKYYGHQPKADFKKIKR